MGLYLNMHADVVGDVTYDHCTPDQSEDSNNVQFVYKWSETSNPNDINSYAIVCAVYNYNTS